MKVIKLLTASALSFLLLACGGPVEDGPAVDQDDGGKVEIIDQEEPSSDEEAQEDPAEEDAPDSASPTDETESQVKGAVAGEADAPPADSAAPLSDSAIIDRVLEADDHLDTQAQFLVVEEEEGVYQVEVRQDQPDGNASNLTAIYRYDLSADQVYKQNQLTGKFELIEE